MDAITTVAAVLSSLPALEKILQKFSADNHVARKVRELQTELSGLLTNAYAELVKRETSDLAFDEKEALFTRKNKIECIKLLRERTKMGLKEAKDFVEDKMEAAGYGRYFPATESSCKSDFR